MALADRTIHTWRTSDFRYPVCPRLPAVYDEIQRLVPGDRLDFDPIHSVWRLRGIYWLTLRRALTQDCDLGPVQEYQDRSDYNRSNPRQRPAAEDQHAAEAYETLFLLPGAPDDVTEAAYRALARIHHSDRGGDGRRMAAINGAREQIAKQRKRRLEPNHVCLLFLPPGRTSAPADAGVPAPPGGYSRNHPARQRRHRSADLDAQVLRFRLPKHRGRRGDAGGVRSSTPGTRAAFSSRQGSCATASGIWTSTPPAPPTFCSRSMNPASTDGTRSAPAG